jgi:DNA-binding MarR family transcriptional regulator
VTKLAEILGVTKGAVSQKVGRLTKKGILLKNKKINQDKEVALSLTEKGWLAFNRHENSHRNLYREFMDDLSGITDDQIDTFKRILDVLEGHLDSHIK